MSTPSNSKKKKVVGKVKKEASKTKIKPTVSKRKSGAKTTVTSTPLLFGRENFKWMFIGLGVIILGMILMAGGSMPSPDVWDESLIYSFRRITLAPIVILIGLGIEVYAIFK